MNSHRHLSILELVPISPSSISTQQLQQKLLKCDFDIPTRMLQRDLQSLYEQGCFGLEKDTRSKPYGWSINAQWRSSNSKVMSAEVAGHYLLLEQLLPQSVPSDVKQSVHTKAEQALKRFNGHVPEWLSILPKPSLKVNVDSQLIAQIEHAIKHNRTLSAELYRVLYDEAHWLKFTELSFYNLVEQGGVLMAQFMVGELHDKCYQMPVYRIRNVHILQKTRREPSAEQLKSLRSAINKGMKQETIELVAKVPIHSAVNQGFIELGELTNKQSIDEKSVLLTYQTIDTEQLTDELFKCAHWLEVIKPEKLRQRITTKLKSAANIYK
ncbi:MULTISPECIES: helix-turn-helix transcriptional regulator [unclassified Pseudoalteromonas]|uniref:helix-turn-helix transcriptional regulator n=1 Tax=unclassified Pseudoalteromonas TaxID=194690 RepID=UPI0023582FBB|nr:MULTISPECIES: WYL domain-containing protein [unclassified Pseudoalteromonas]MDC9565650.1 WYL domain-containing protein [Pseudoalteromonas sp. GAB2316C]MDC9569939.1 WYL domain-containing protein [Pseudoalteromonas sp. GABNB9D]MDC9574092.1 WYL domain-containing protein [Pseudoalteromonas sp. GABNS16A]MDC9578455.1 WYL domain-containing protein [Pseudoalteromonas sp. GABNS16E]MDC9586022.1 WYL domain-containing protein [Pseudoalteromonas sp. GABNS16C]